jgi:hypothetical protein
MSQRSLEEFVAAKKHADVLDSLVVWHNVIPHAAHLGRSIAPDHRHWQWTRQVPAAAVWLAKLQRSPAFCAFVG